MGSKIWKLGLLGASVIAYKQRNSLTPRPFRSAFILKAEELKETNVTQPSRITKYATDQCILVIGTTGTGKSSTIGKCTKQTVVVGDLADSVTKSCQIFPELNNESNPVWIDTVGYDDTSNVDDAESFKEVLKFIQEQRLLKIKAIIWTILPQERKDARLQRQAEFINRFKEEAIWDNVIIIAKQPGSFSLYKACQGAEEAAKVHCNEIKNIQKLGFTYLDNSIPDDFKEVLLNLDPEKRKGMLYLTEDEVYEKINGAIESIKQPIRVIFEDSECEHCGVQGDKRLLPDYCHMERLFKHPEPLNHYHPQELKSYHPLPTDNYHPGVLRLTGGPNQNCETVKNVLFAMTPVIGLLKDTTEGIKTGVIAGLTQFVCYKLNEPLRFTFACCAGEENSHGCKNSFACCRTAPDAPGCMYTYPCCSGGPQAVGCTRKYLCCGKEEGVTGCQVVCKKCEQAWGTAAGECFKKNHELRKMNK
eukprot:GFUD01028790.1.p1 GENE.GFUD01028790.1~~GFUD01028790.1.p1  ORF type:complete len:475 (+),score=82.08 GFUD01028790.1:64-1488(+)